MLRISANVTNVTKFCTAQKFGTKTSTTTNGAKGILARKNYSIFHIDLFAGYLDFAYLCSAYSGECAFLFLGDCSKSKG